MIRIACLDDRGGWGRAVHAAARKHGQLAVMFAAGDIGVALQSDVAFMRLDQRQPGLRAEKQAARMLHERGVRLVPDIRQIEMYEDKVLQTQWLHSWMPSTVVLKQQTRSLAAAAIRELGLPFLSKSAEGSSSTNVRAIRSTDEAWAEWRNIFAGEHPSGIRLRNGNRQRGYLLWQEFLKGNDYDYRIHIIGPELAITRRHNRADVPFASGSGSFEDPDVTRDEEAASALDFARSFFKAERIAFAAIDVVRDHGEAGWSARSEWRLLETSVGWSAGKAPWQNRRFVSGRGCAGMFDVIVESVVEGKL